MNQLELLKNHYKNQISQLIILNPQTINYVNGVKK